ncbi:hypothetical protein K1X13_14090 [Nocardioides sp. WL0053]|uniref:Uncharacterized protein n=1 Tax=Nocardioides jiangsuensis TaxID=2866161 RepID=A0ABS7RLN5_9ACTN|nr:hypothetical protein [Nocardioides jiangsuensis]MBY9075960.1 hypothetical protein [Nocardioides jiangsuensis]
MKTNPELLSISFDGGGLLAGAASARREGAEICRSLGRKARPMAGDRAAMVLVFGGAPEVSTGQAVARAVARQLRCADPNVFARNPATRAFWDGTLPLGKARLEVFLFTTKQKTTTGD